MVSFETKIFRNHVKAPRFSPQSLWVDPALNAATLQVISHPSTSSSNVAAVASRWQHVQFDQPENRTSDLPHRCAWHLRLCIHLVIEMIIFCDVLIHGLFVLELFADDVAIFRVVLVWKEK